MAITTSYHHSKFPLTSSLSPVERGRGISRKKVEENSQIVNIRIK
jgi:hypothetical protein